MTSLFDTAVRNRRQATPWARVDALRFLKEMALNATAEGQGNDLSATISVEYRPDVASRFWWTVTWVSADGIRGSVSSQELDLCLWRAAEVEERCRQRVEAEIAAKRAV